MFVLSPIQEQRQNLCEWIRIEVKLLLPYGLMQRTKNKGKCIRSNRMGLTDAAQDPEERKVICRIFFLM